MEQFTFKYVFNLPLIEIDGSINEDSIGSTAASKVAKNIYSQLHGWQKENIGQIRYSSKELKKSLRLSITSDTTGEEKDPESVGWEVINTLLRYIQTNNTIIP